MCLVIFSGFFGVWTYRTYPSERNALKKSQSLDEIFLQLEEIDAQMTRLCGETNSTVRDVVTSSIERTVIGGSYTDQLFGRDKSQIVIDGAVIPNTQQQKALDYLVERRTRSQGEESTLLAEMIRALGNRKRLLGTIREDIRMQAMIQVWLMFHIPLTFALFAALIAHVFAVFVYW
jgi:hypothetical protein